MNGLQFGSVPYYETFGYDAFSNLTARQSDLWNGVFSDTDSASYTDFRRQGWGYDADGRNTTIDTRTSTFDAVGRQTSMLANEVLPNGTLHLVSQTNGYDAEGAMVHEAVSGVSRYYLRSSVLGGAIIEEIGSGGQKNVGYVYAALGTQLARQYAGSVTWKHNTPAQASQYTSNSANSAIGRTEFDPLGADVPLTEPITAPPNEGEGDLNFGRFAALMDARWSDFHNLAAGCGLAAAGCTGHVNGRTLEAAMLAAFGARRYDLPGQGNESARGEERYERQLSDGFDNEFQHFEGATITYNNGVVANNATLTLDQYHRWETGYLPDSGTVNLNSNTVTIYGGAQYFVPAQKTPLTIGQVDDLRKDLSHMLTNRECAAFTKALLKQLEHADSDNPLALFDSVRKQGGFYAIPTYPPAGEGASTIGNGNARIGVRTLSANMVAPIFHNNLARTLFHELVHVASNTKLNFGHPEMARAAFLVALTQGSKNIAEPPKRGSKDYDYQSSVYFESRLDEACKMR